MCKQQTKSKPSTRQVAASRELRTRRRVRCRILLFKYGRPAAIILILVVISMLDRRGYLLATPEDGHRYHLREARVVRVIDGDTFEIDLPDEAHGTPTTRVRLWGVDCPERARLPESDHGTPHPAEAWAEEATEFTRRLIENKAVRLRIEPQRTRGAYGRLLAHVDILDPADTDDVPGSSQAETNLAVELLRAGLARREIRWLHSMMAYYEQIEHTARRQGVGIWTTPDESQN